MKLDNSALFLEKLKTGINLFTGAGFSILPDPQGKALPRGSDLAHELMEQFDIDDIFEGDLTYICSLIPPDDLDEFLRSRFTVHSYNPLYEVINKINLLTYITTNIDNIIRLVIRNGKTYYLNNIREYGAPTNNPNELYYIPLHGDVLDKNSKLYFGKGELAQVGIENKDLFEIMYARLVKGATLFAGYSFNDGAVMGVISKIIQNGAHDIWVQCMPEDKKNIVFFRNCGCNVIEADTETLLKWIDKNLIENSRYEKIDLDKALTRYRVPELSEVTAIQTNEYYQQGNTDWYPIMVNVPYERKEVAKIYDRALTKKNVIIIGERFTGKTTMLMQIALKVNSQIKLYLKEPNIDLANFICTHLEGKSAWIFIQNCAADIESYKTFAQHSNLYVVGSADIYQYESACHLIDLKSSCDTINISELTKEEAKQIYSKIPFGLRKQPFTYKEKGSLEDKYSMLEFVGSNIKESISKTRIKILFSELLSSHKEYLEIIALASYLSDNNSALSYSIVSRYFNILIYPDAVELVNRTISYLRSYSGDVSEHEEYYILRSKLFAVQTKKILRKNFKDFYSSVIEKFIKEISQYYVMRYDVFRRRAYDAELLSDLFSYEKINELFKLLFDRNPTCYVLQQWALCKMKFKHFKEAFADIDRALNIAPTNFSIRNSQAIILFEANKYEKTEKSFKSLKDAMEILQQCYLNDKRKVYHAQKFAEFAIILKKYHTCSDYIEIAKTWINDVLAEQGENATQKIRKLKRELDLE